MKETYAESHEERKKHLNKMRQQRRRRNAAEKAKSKTASEGGDDILNNEVYIQGLRARYRRQFKEQVKDVQPPVEPSRVRPPLPQLTNPYWLLENIIGFVPPQKHHTQSWKEHFEAVFQAIVPGVTIETVYLSLLLFESSNWLTNLSRLFGTCVDHK
jgi:hypothetical protein